MARVTLKNQGELVSFLSAGKADIRSLKVYFSPKQSGTGDPSPENVRPIVGWTGVEVEKRGKNLLWTDPSNWEQGQIQTGGNRIYNTTRIRTKVKFRILPDTTYTVSHSSYIWPAWHLWTEDLSYISDSGWKSAASVTFTTPSNAAWIEFTCRQSANKLISPDEIGGTHTVQLELGSTATTYEPYTGTTHTIDWNDTLGTIYGGYVDLISGEVVEEWGIIASYNGESLASEWLSDRDVYASGTTPTIGAQVAYELATPITHQLTPTEIQTLTGQNTFWSTADRIEVEYDLIETRDTWMRRRNIIAASQPHLKSLTGTSLQFKTDMTNRLKECRVHFTPIQEGTGDPSPDNVRPISGWDGIEISKSGKNLYSYNGGSTGGYQPVFLKAGKTYCASSIGGGYLRIKYEDETTSDIMWLDKIKNDEIRYRTFTPSKNVIGALIFRAVGLMEPMIELGSTPTNYEPYSCTSLTIPFPQTIYGGYVDLVKGEVVEEWKEYVYPSKTNLFTDRGNGYYEVGFGDVNGKGYGSANNSMCSKLSYGFRITSKIGYELNYVLLGKSNRFHTLVYSDTPMTNETARQWFIDNNIQLVRLVYTPTIYSIDPITLRTLRGQNNIWSDANGNIEIKYWTH